MRATLQRLGKVTSAELVIAVVLISIFPPVQAYGVADAFATNPFPTRWSRNSVDCVDYDAVNLNVAVGDLEDVANCAPSYYVMSNPVGTAFTSNQLDDMHLVFSVKFNEQLGAEGGPLLAWGGFIKTGSEFGDGLNAMVTIEFQADLTNNCFGFRPIVRFDGGTMDSTSYSACTYLFNTFYGVEVRFVGGLSERELDVRVGTEWNNVSVQQVSFIVGRVAFATEQGLTLKETVDNVDASTGDLGYGTGGSSAPPPRPNFVQKGFDAAVVFMFLGSMILLLAGAYWVKKRRGGGLP